MLPVPQSGLLKAAECFFCGILRFTSNREICEERMHRAYFTALALFLLVSPAAAACVEAAGSGEFQMSASAWGEADDQFKTQGNEATLTPQIGTQTARWNAGLSLNAVEVCATFAMPETTSDASRSYAGLLFWVTDKDNFYQAVISPNGMFTVARKAAGRIVATLPVNWTQSAAVKTGPGAKNVLRVTANGQNITLHINDTEVARFRGQPPEAASHAGIVASSAPSAVDTWRVSGFSAADPAPASTPAAAEGTSSGEGEAVTGAIDAASTGCGSGKPLYDGAFAEYDTNWGPKDSKFDIANGVATFTPAPGTPALRWNRVFVFGDMDACAEFTLANNTANPTASYAGLVFWVQDSRNYYQAVLAPNGYFTVARIVDGKALPKRPVAWTKLDAAKTGSKQKNTMRVTIKGEQVDIAVNGSPAGSFRGEPPRWPSHIGLLAASASSKNGDTWQVGDLKVTAPQ